MNARYEIFTNPQKDFIKKTNGCSEHGIMLNELFLDARRGHKGLVMTIIHFTNAFGSVPHELIMSTMRQRNLSEWRQSIMSDMYTAATSIIELKGNRSDPIAWKRGVKQGFPLSPLLFNLCLEPRLQLVKKRHSGTGAFVQVGDERVEFNVQAYVDDVVFISERLGSVQEMLSTLDAYVRWARMEVNVAKCATASYLIEGNNHRCTLDQELIFRGQGIPNLTLAQSLKYLGTAISARRKVRLKAAIAKCAEMEMRLQKIIGSRFLTVQKINAMKTFLLQTLDFMMLNSDVGKKQMKKMDAKIRAQMDALLNVRGLPVECHHAS
jgi:hypothetical protein